MSAQVATVSPAGVNMAETLSTLRFADQAKRIKNQVGACHCLPLLAHARHHCTSQLPLGARNIVYESNLPPLRCCSPGLALCRLW